MPLDSLTNQTVAHLERARQRLVTLGWSHDGPKDGDKVCVLLAIGNTTNCRPGQLHSDRVNAALAKFKRAINGSTIYAWNDAPERTEADIHAAFDRAIELAMEEVP